MDSQAKDCTVVMKFVNNAFLFRVLAKFGIPHVQHEWSDGPADESNGPYM